MDVFALFNGGFLSADNVDIFRFVKLGFRPEDFDQSDFSTKVEMAEILSPELGVSVDRLLVGLINGEDLADIEPEEITEESLGEFVSDNVVSFDDLFTRFSSVSESTVETELSAKAEVSVSDGLSSVVNLESLVEGSDRLMETGYGDHFTLVQEEFVEEIPMASLNIAPVVPLEQIFSCDIEQPIPLTKGRSDRVCLEKLQATVDSILPTHSRFDDTFHQAFVENSDINLDFERIKLKQYTGDWYRDPDRFYEPALKSGGCARRVGTQKEALIAIRKRNADVPELAGSVDIDKTAKWVADVFFKSYVSSLKPLEQVMSRMKAYCDKWKDRVDPLAVLSGTNLQRYQHMIKTDVKPVVADGMNLERAVPATITFHDKITCANFSPWFTALFDGFQKSLIDRVRIPSGPISTLEMNYGFKNKYYVEIDLSKFDKSQGELHLEFQRLLLLRLGLPAHLVNWWCELHIKSFISDPNAGVAFPCAYQRRTGDAFTYFGNTLVTMAEFACCFDCSQFEIMLFSGDDSLAVSNNPIAGDTDLFTSLFNMESKSMEDPVPYICSKFLIEDSFGRSFSVPDPIREFQRLGKKKILIQPNCDPLFEQYQGFRDRMKYLRHMDDFMIDQLKVYFDMKYKKGKDCIDDFLGGCIYYADNFQHFKELFFTPQAIEVKALVNLVDKGCLGLPSRF
ncbi:putative polymerase [Cassava Ivorian bacilliform virus]|uniref:putative polymerase n=1 Tax=Cassava Ivorian bacilliform virus TaxID=1464778 RepID=UPI0003F20F63|nr:putative polymerase [Cassava Ivorian bacilliform virus]AHJ89006.1 putative polymerase [Cassava Ivorian bacilliform virus]